jgi:hypothetical protein
MPLNIPIIIDSESDSYSSILQQLVYITNENESIFYIRNLNNIKITTKIDRILITIAILKRGGYIKDISSNYSESDSENTYSSVFHYYLDKKFNIRNNEVFNADWNRSQSGHWSYIIK